MGLDDSRRVTKNNNNKEKKEKKISCNGNAPYHIHFPCVYEVLRCFYTAMMLGATSFLRNTAICHTFVTYYTAMAILRTKAIFRASAKFYVATILRITQKLRTTATANFLGFAKLYAATMLPIPRQIYVGRRSSTLQRFSVPW